jgi:hypothetical protein
MMQTPNFYTKRYATPHQRNELFQEISKLKHTPNGANSAITALQAENSKLTEDFNKSINDLTTLKEELILSKAEQRYIRGRNRPGSLRPMPESESWGRAGGHNA